MPAPAPGQGQPWLPAGPPAGPPRRRQGWYLVLAAAVLGVFVFCGIVVAAAGSSDRPAKTQDVARHGALPPPVSAPATAGPSSAAAGAATAGDTAATSTAPAASSAPAAGGGTPAKPATTRPATTKPATKPTTKAPAPNCNPNYTPCVPNDPVDVDCAGGSGNGPSYVQGPVHVIGSDPYKLDSDGDGIGCE